MRKATNKVIEMVENGVLDPGTIIRACLMYMSDDDVLDMMRANDLLNVCDDCGADLDVDTDPNDINLCRDCEVLDEDTEEEEEDKCESCETELHGNDVKLCASCANDAMDDDTVQDNNNPAQIGGSWR